MKIGRAKKTSICLEIEKIEGIIKHQEMVGKMRLNPKEGLRITTEITHRENFLNVVKKLQEEKRIVHLQSYEMQANHLQWCNGEPRITQEERESKEYEEWKTLTKEERNSGKYSRWHKMHERKMQESMSWRQMMISYTPRMLKFLLNANANTLPSRDNLRLWGRSKTFRCGLCAKENVTTLHILAGCTWVRNVENKKLKEDRYTWRHNCVLSVQKKMIEKKVKEANEKKSFQNTLSLK